MGGNYARRWAYFRRFFCDTNLYADGPQTVVEAQKIDRSMCPHYKGECSVGFLNTHGCAMLLGLHVARNVLKDHSTIKAEMREFHRDHFIPPQGWIYSLDRKEFKIIPDGELSAHLIEQFAHVVIGDGEVKELKRSAPKYQETDKLRGRP